MTKTAVKERKHEEKIEPLEEKEESPEKDLEKDEQTELLEEMKSNVNRETYEKDKKFEAHEVELLEVEEIPEKKNQEAQASLEEKIREYEEQNLRIRAEFANYKKRVEREQLEFTKYFKGEILLSLLSIMDDFKMMFEKSSEGENEKSILEGAKLIYEKLLQILEKEGLEKVNALGEKFDPEIHEALMMKPIDNEDDHNKVIEVFQEGYKLQDRLLRPSKVIVGQYEDNQT